MLIDKKITFARQDDRISQGLPVYAAINNI